MARSGPPTGGHHQIAFGEKRVGDPDRCVERPAGVVAEVEDEVLHALGPEPFDGLAHLAGAARGEL